MFKLSEKDIKKIMSSLAFNKDLNNYIHFTKGTRQSFIRNEINEKDDMGELLVSFSGTDIILDNEIPEEFLLKDGASFLKKYGQLRDGVLDFRETPNGGLDLVMSEGDNFEYSICLAEPNIIYKQYCNDKEVIALHKSYLEHGLTKSLENNSLEQLSLFISMDDLSRINQFTSKNVDLINFTVSDHKATVCNVDDTGGSSFKFTFQGNVNIDIDLSFNVSSNKLVSLPKQDYSVTLYYKNEDVQGVLMSGTSDGVKFFMPLLA